MLSCLKIKFIIFDLPTPIVATVEQIKIELMGSYDRTLFESIYVLSSLLSTI